MATYHPPKRGVAYTTYVALVDQSNTKLHKISPTLAVGDWKVSKDGGALTNLATLPVVEPAGSVMVKIVLSASEMTADHVTVVGIDAAGAEWASLVLDMATVANQLDDLATQSSVNTVDDFLDTEIADIQSRLPAVLVSGRIDASAGAVANNAITAAAIATDAITAAKIADGAIDAAAFASGALDAVWSVATRTLSAFGFSVTVTTNNDKTGYSLSAAAVQAIWDVLTSALSTANSIGKLFVDNMNATIGSRATQTSVDTIDDFIDTEMAAVLAAVDTEVAAIKTVTDALTAAAAAKLALSAATIVSGAAVAGTLSATQMTTDLSVAVDDHYNGRIVIWTSGALQNQATDITDYDGATKRLTFTAVTSAPVAGVTFVIV